MASSPVKSLRCAIYTRKSTEHGLDLEFNSLDAQREACEAYIKSQASLGWQGMPKHYDDPAYSGGNLERPALQALLRDIEAGKIDVVVVYKIDRLTRSLADFAKLVEAFDKQAISFVAVTQQFNTTTSMGRLTLNVLLSFAQFERELSSERVRDKIAASRRKGKWTGGTVPLGYSIKSKKLIPHTKESGHVRYIFKRYLELGSLPRLVKDLDEREILTKRRDTKIKKYQGGIRFTHGPLAYLLRNRVYVGETHHGGNWYAGEHTAIIDPETFNQVQDQLSANRIKRVNRPTPGNALLMGKLFDDRGNVMGPSYSTKNGIRYRFYVSSALLRGRKADVGSVGRISAPPLETALTDFIAQRFENHTDSRERLRELVDRTLARVEVRKTCVRISIRQDDGSDDDIESVDIPWVTNSRAPAPQTQAVVLDPDPHLLTAIVRAHAWLRQLEDGTYGSIEDLAQAQQTHPNFVRAAIRAAFIDPAITTEILQGRAERQIIARLKNEFGLSWSDQRRTAGLAEH